MGVSVLIIRPYSVTHTLQGMPYSRRPREQIHDQTTGRHELIDHACDVSQQGSLGADVLDQDGVSLNLTREECLPRFNLHAAFRIAKF